MLVNIGAMDVSVRKCRSLWDSEVDSSHHGLDIKNTWAAKDDYPSHDGRSFKEHGYSKADSSSKRHSGWNHAPQNSLLQSCQRTRRDVERLEKEDHKREKFYCENVSPTFDALRQQRNNKFSEHSLSHPNRLPGRGRSRSPGRAKGRSRSRSWSRDREWRNRSRSRSRDRGNLRDRRSRCSPPNYNVDSFESDHRQIGSQISSKVCRDFAIGRCRRGGECWFSHPDNFKVNDGYSSEHNLTERWSGKHRNGDVSRYDNSESETIEIQCQGKIPDAYDIENDQPRNNRGIITCKNFGRGNCRWGASCRFSHSGCSSQIYDGSIRNASPDYNWKSDPSKTSRPLCKYFVAGKCYTANCRFSHDGPTRFNVEPSHSNEIGGHRYDDKKHNIVGLKWDDVEMDPSFNMAPIGENVAKANHLDAVHSDTVDPIRDPDLVNPKKFWNESAWDVGTAKMLNLEKTSEQVDPTAREKFSITVPVDHNNNRWAQNLESERAMWPNTTFCEGRDVYPNVTATNTSEYSLESLSNNKECNVISKASQLQSLAGSSVHGERQDTNEDASRLIFHSNSILPYGSPNPHLESYPFWGTGNSNIANAINDVNIYRHGTHPEVLPEQRFSEISKRANQGSEYYSFSDGAAQGEPMMHAIPSNGHSIMPNDSTNYQKKEAATTSEVLHFSMTQNLSGATFSVPTTRMQSPAPLTDENHEIWYESGKSQQHASVPSSVVCSDSNSGLLPTFNAVYTRLDSVKNAPDLCQAAQARGDESQMPVNIVKHVNASNLSEQGTKDALKEMNQSSSLNFEVGNIKVIKQCAASNVDCTKEQYLTHPDSVAKSTVNEHNRLISKCSEDEQQNNNPDNVNVPGKGEVVNGNKDDKVARLFKISLIESVKEILKPTWKEGQMSREVHKNIVKKVVDKVMGSIQGGHFPKTQDKIEHYISHSKAKISKLAQAYVERSHKETS